MNGNLFINIIEKKFPVILKAKVRPLNSEKNIWDEN
jgi:hypothetical protein